MAKKVTLTESELIKMIQQIVKENKASEMGEQSWLPGTKAYKRKKALKKALKTDDSGEEKDEFALDTDERGEKKRQKKIRGGSIQTLLTDLATAEPPAYYDKLQPTPAEVNAIEKDVDGNKDYIKIMNELVLNKLYSVYGAISAVAYFIRSSKNCDERYMPEKAENDSLKGLTSLTAYIEKLEMYTKFLRGPIKGIVKDFIKDFKGVVKLVQKEGKKYFNDKNIRGAEGIFRDYSENFERVALQKKAFKTAQQIITGTDETGPNVKAPKDPCHFDFE